MKNLLMFILKKSGRMSEMFFNKNAAKTIQTYNLIILLLYVYKANS